jgi:transcriptional regulator with XRE-family HTH domain
MEWDYPVSMPENEKSPPGEEIRALRIAQGLSQVDVAKALDISTKTVGRLEREGRGHNLRRVRTFLEQFSASKDATASVQSLRTFIREQSVPGARPLSLAFHELAALLESIPDEQRSPAAQTFVDVQRQLEDASIDPLKTLEAAAQVTIKAFSQFRPRHEIPE